MYACSPRDLHPQILQILMRTRRAQGLLASSCSRGDLLSQLTKCAKLLLQLEERQVVPTFAGGPLAATLAVCKSSTFQMLLQGTINHCSRRFRCQRNKQPLAKVVSLAVLQSAASRYRVRHQRLAEFSKRDFTTSHMSLQIAERTSVLFDHCQLSGIRVFYTSSEASSYSRPGRTSQNLISAAPPMPARHTRPDN